MHVHTDSDFLKLNNFEIRRQKNSTTPTVTKTKMTIYVPNTFFLLKPVITKLIPSQLVHGRGQIWESPSELVTDHEDLTLH
jgi:hypothetical protein